MSRILNASQYDKAYSPHKLGNWEQPDKSKVVKAATGGAAPHKTADGRTIPIVNEYGHIIASAKKAAAFVTQPAVWQQSAARWPERNPTIKGTPASTMGYKGIQTGYLPTSTVSLKAVEIEGCKEFNYAGGPH